MSAYITAPDGQQKCVSNLRWILDNSRIAERIEVCPPEQTFRSLVNGQPGIDLCPHTQGNDKALMLVWCKGGGVYACKWADHTNLWSWLGRPKFKGLPLNWFGIETTCGADGFKG